MNKEQLLLAICKLSQAAYYAGVMRMPIPTAEHEDALKEVLKVVEKIYETN